MRHSMYLCSFLTMILATTLVPLELHSEDTQLTKEDVRQAIRAAIVLEAPPEAEEAAIAGKQVLPRLIKNDDRHARDLGFSSAAEAADANTQLGRPFAFIVVSLDKLKQFRPGIDPVSLLIPTLRFLYPIYPLTAGNAPTPPLSSLTVIKTSSTSGTGKDWRAIGWGAHQLIRFLAAAQDEGNASALSFVVRIEELSRYFLADLKNDKFVIIPLLNEKKYGFVAGTPLDAEFVFLKLISEIPKILDSKR